jgi:hypothetical protein
MDRTAHAARDGLSPNALGHGVLCNLDLLDPRLVVVCFEGLGFRV